MTYKAAAKTTKSPRGKDPMVLGRLGLDLLDTTWRIMVPVLLFALIGIFADRKLETAPWLSLLGVVIGFVCAGWLVKKQLEAVEREEEKS